MRALIVCTGESLKHYINKIKHVERDVSIGIHNMDGKFVPDYHLFVSLKRYKKYRKKGFPDSTYVLIPKIKPYHKKHIVMEYTNDYPSKDGELSVIGKRIVGRGLVGGTAALGFAYTIGATEVWFAGMDGYSQGAHHFYEEKDNTYSRLMEHEEATIKILKDWEQKVDIKIITPTVYKQYYDETILGGIQ